MNRKICNPEDVDVTRVDACGACPWERSNHCVNPRTGPVRPGGKEIDCDTGDVPDWCPLRQHPDLVLLDLKRELTVEERLEKLQIEATAITDALERDGHAELAQKFHEIVWGFVTKE